ncbi:GxxExxY protein [Candidatus Sumerlaeota bacterium]|nr:GxxExxY protein [Candidatus Sumerlaeota bacterium]
MTELLHREKCCEIVGAAMRVWNELGPGFLERVYENALMIELQEAGIHAEQQRPVTVHYHGQRVGEYTVDILVDDEIILELKAVERIVDAHVAQILNYLKATGKRLGIILNFGPKGLEHRRPVM